MRELYINVFTALRSDTCLRAQLLAGYGTNDLTEIWRIVRLECPSHVDTFGVVQSVSDHMGLVGQLDEESTHWAGVVARKRSSTLSITKTATTRVSVSSLSSHLNRPSSWFVSLTKVRGNLKEVVDALAPKDLLKLSARGIFLIRRGMGDLTLHCGPESDAAVGMVEKFDTPAD